MKPNTCSNCGAPSLSGQIVCEYCGNSLGTNSYASNTYNNDLSSSTSSNIIGSSNYSHKTPAEIVLLLVCTCGIYYFVLIYDWLKTINSVDEKSNSTDPALAIFFIIISCGIAGIYYEYLIAKKTASITRKSGGSSSPLRQGINPPLDNLSDIVLWGGIVCWLINFLSAGSVGIIWIVFVLWSKVALQHSVEYMMAVRSS